MFSSSCTDVFRKPCVWLCIAFAKRQESIGYLLVIF